MAPNTLSFTENTATPHPYPLYITAVISKLMEIEADICTERGQRQQMLRQQYAQKCRDECLCRDGVGAWCICFLESTSFLWLFWNFFDCQCINVFLNVAVSDDLYITHGYCLNIKLASRVFVVKNRIWQKCDDDWTNRYRRHGIEYSFITLIYTKNR